MQGKKGRVKELVCYTRGEVSWGKKLDRSSRLIPNHGQVSNTTSKGAVVARTRQTPPVISGRRGEAAGIK
jgi:hypothetical protein